MGTSCACAVGVRRGGYDGAIIQAFHKGRDRNFLTNLKKHRNNFSGALVVWL